MGESGWVSGGAAEPRWRSRHRLAGSEGCSEHSRLFTLSGKKKKCSSRDVKKGSKKLSWFTAGDWEGSWFVRRRFINLEDKHLHADRWSSASRPCCLCPWFGWKTKLQEKTGTGQLYHRRQSLCFLTVVFFFILKRLGMASGRSTWAMSSERCVFFRRSS